MSSIFLDDYLDNAEFALRRQIRVLAAEQPLSAKGIHAMCTMFRKRGACSLLLTGNPVTYYVSSMQSAAAFLFYLERATDGEKVTSFAKPFFDAIAGGYWDAAQNIALRSRATHNSDFEYEDDFLYVRVLQELFFLEASADTIGKLIQRYESVREGKPDVRLDLCRIFVERDLERFDVALEELLDRRSQELENLVSRGGTTEEEATWLRPYSNEATASLKLRERQGFVTQRSYSQVPDAVRPESPYKFSLESWRTIDFTPYHR